MPAYRIRNWQKIYEVSDAKRTAPGRPLAWIAIPTKHDGRGFRRLMRRGEHDGMAIFAAFILMVEVAAKLPERGTLKDDDGPLTAEDLADKTGGESEVFDKALEVLSSNDFGIKWLEIVEDSPEYPNVNPLRTDGRTDETDRTDGRLLPASAGTRDEHAATRTDAPNGPNPGNGTGASPPERGKRREQARRPNRSKPAEQSKHHELIEFFTTRWREKYGEKYPFAEGRDGAHVKWVLKAVDGNMAKAKSAIVAYLANDEPFTVRQRHPLGLFKSQFPRYLVPVEPEPPQNGEVVHPSDAELDAYFARRAAQ